MALNIPTNSNQLELNAKTDLQRELPTTANPFLQESWFGATAVMCARRVMEFFRQLVIALNESIPITAVEKLPDWAAVWGVTKNPATPATGIIVATGTAGTVIPDGTIIRSTDSNLYAVSGDTAIIAQSYTPVSVTSVGLTATVTLAVDVSMYAGLSVVIAGATQGAYNGTFTVTPTDGHVFTYTLPSAAASPATGTISVSITTAELSVVSSESGQDQNLSPNTRVSFATPIAGVDSTAFVDQDAVAGGTDIESDDELRSRMLERIQNPVAMFNTSAIVAQAKTVSGVTQVFVHEMTPEVGQVTIYFIRGNDASPIPDGSEVTTVKNKILEIKPAHTDEDDVIVLAPTAVNVTFSFSALSPNTATMQAAIEANLRAYFLDEGTVGNPITQDEYRAVIQTTIDPDTGDRVESFGLTTPTGSLGGGVNEYCLVSAVNFP